MANHIAARIKLASWPSAARPPTERGLAKECQVAVDPLCEREAPGADRGLSARPKVTNGPVAARARPTVEV